QRVEVVRMSGPPHHKRNISFGPIAFDIDHGGTHARTAPSNFVLDGSQVVGVYNVPGGAVAGDFVSDQGGPRVVSNDLQLIFWGSWWLNGSNPGASDVINMVHQTLSSPYLSELSQYGFQNLNLRTPIIVSNPDAIGNLKFNDAGDLIWDHLIDNDVFPEPDDGGRFIYMVFLPPTATLVDSAGGSEHSIATDTDPFTFDQDTAWVAVSSYGDLPYMTVAFTHELAETITDPDIGTPAWVMNRTIRGGDEIGDACVGADWYENLFVQAYWSQHHGGCVIPFGNFMPLGTAGQTQSVARMPDRLDTFWTAPDGSVWTNWWFAEFNNARWNSPIQVAPPGSALADTVAATARTPVHLDVFWVHSDGSVWSNWWDLNVNNGQWNAPFQLAPPGSATSSKIAAVSRTPDHLDVFWIGQDGSVQSNWWDANINSARWNTPFNVASAGSAKAGMVAAVSRMPDHLDVFWIGRDKSVNSNWWDLNVNNAHWNTPFQVSGPGSARFGQITAVARTPNHLDVFWITRRGAVATNWWDADFNNAHWNTPFQIAGNGSALGGITAVSRRQDHSDVFWVAPDGSVGSNWWDANVNSARWNTPFSIAPAGSAVPSVLSAVGRLPEHLDVFWVEPNGAIGSNWWDANVNNGNWNTPFDVAGAGSASSF
ncbi:MAG TPA: hypothetical protein VFA71_00415, partial [Terriglobales bacterium]|nr:hypothetical protein [Terriglobales bacterium]